MIENSPKAGPVLPYDAEQFASQRDTGAPTWLRALRERAIAGFAELGLPTTRLEEWRYTNVSALSRGTFAAVDSPPSVSRDALQRIGVPDLGGDRLVFVDGHFVDALSDRRDAGAIEIHSLAESIQQAPELEAGSALAELATIAAPKGDAFTSLNTAWAHDGAVVVLPRNARPEQPVQLVFVSSGSSESATIHFPRVLIVAREGSEARVIQDHVSLDGAAERVVCCDSVCEVRVESNATLRMLLVQREGEGTTHIARQAIRQARDSRFSIHTFNLGGTLVRNDLSVVLEDEGAECDLVGLYLGGGAQVIDNHTLVDHAMPRCASRERYKGILGDASRGVFRGRVLVRPDAQKTDASQQNSNLLTSSKAEVDTKPQLEIYADDVKCSHGSSIGQLDPEALFFMRSRGLDEAEARALLTEGFASEISDSLPDDDAGAWIRRLVIARVRELFGRAQLRDTTQEER